MTADLAGQAGEEFHGIWHALVDVQLGAARQRSMSIIARQFWFAPCGGYARAYCQRHHSVPPIGRIDGVVGELSCGDRITSCQG
ncbi:Uncharacterised protein [Mycobacterium tuberculosis]|uniref:Uncharacterized protein n=1 Tax=Mycobacterium tuberculosis TaxID=1773 RepID=A0A916PCJ5_MYCTX|nr:Uncharacterised protein [Mycobacterium tuberculosis]COZ07810.1 Uncharacterised protein [Mycobacterium tuberculosis]